MFPYRTKDVGRASKLNKLTLYIFSSLFCFPYSQCGGLRTRFPPGEEVKKKKLKPHNETWVFVLENIVLISQNLICVCNLRGFIFWFQCELLEIVLILNKDSDMKTQTLISYLDLFKVGIAQHSACCCTAGTGDRVAQWVERRTQYPKDRGSNPIRSPRKICEFLRVRNVVLTRCQCAQPPPPCVYACTRMITYAWYRSCSPCQSFVVLWVDLERLK